MENRAKRDLPEVVAEILIEQHAMREAIDSLQATVENNEAAQQRRHEEMIAVYNNQTNAILDAMNRGNDRYHQTNKRVDQVETRVTNLENPPA